MFIKHRPGSILLEGSLVYRVCIHIATIERTWFINRSVLSMRKDEMPKVSSSLTGLHGDEGTEYPQPSNSEMMLLVVGRSAGLSAQHFSIISHTLSCTPSGRGGNSEKKAIAAITSPSRLSKYGGFSVNICHRVKYQHDDQPRGKHDFSTSRQTRPKAKMSVSTVIPFEMGWNRVVIINSGACHRTHPFPSWELLLSSETTFASPKSAIFG